MDSGPLVPATSPIIREMQPLAVDLGKVASPRVYPELLSQESALGEYVRILMKRKWTVLACLVTVFSLVAIASLKMTPVYEASGSIAINKPDSGLVNFSNSPTFSVDYYDPTEMETEVKILQSDLLALQVVKELALDRRAEFGGKTAQFPSSLDLAPDPLQADTGHTTSLLSSFRSNLKVTLAPNTHIIEVHYRSPDKELAANVVNTLMTTYTENNFKSRFDSTMQASDWLSKQLVDLQMKVETSQEKLVHYQKEHEILGMDEKQNITTSKLDELNKALTTAESERMDKESVYRLVLAGDSETIASAVSALDPAGTGSQVNERLLNFDPSGATTTTTLPLNIPKLFPGEFIYLVVAWDQPYVTGSPNSGGSTSSIDICIQGGGADVVTDNNSFPNSVSCSGGSVIGQDPVQFLIIGNPASASGYTAAESVTITIGLASGTTPGRVKFVLEDDGAGSTINSPFNTNSPTIQGHPSAATAAAVGAAYFINTPQCGTTPATLETYSSAGGDPTLFDTSGNRLATPVIRQKPDFVGPDGINNTMLGDTLADQKQSITTSIAGSRPAASAGSDRSRRCRAPVPRGCPPRRR